MHFKHFVGDSHEFVYVVDACAGASDNYGNDYRPKGVPGSPSSDPSSLAKSLLKIIIKKKLKKKCLKILSIWS